MPVTAVVVLPVLPPNQLVIDRYDGNTAELAEVPLDPELDTQGGRGPLGGGGRLAGGGRFAGGGRRPGGGRRAGGGGRG